MAIVLPLLLFMVFGIIDFGRMLNAQVTVTSAAREGARWAALSQPDVATRVTQAAPGLTGVTTAVVSSCSASSPITANAEVRVTYSFQFATPLGILAGAPGLSGTKILSGTGVMRCGG